jgi:hypothetical protein
VVNRACHAAAAAKTSKIIAASERAFKPPTRHAPWDKPIFVAVHKNRQSTWRPGHGKMTPSGSNRRRPLHMPQLNLADLESKHRALEAELNEALAHPSTDDLKLAELKRRKLQVKDEIARMRGSPGVSIH